MIMEFMFYFFVYGFLGWVVEVVYHAIVQNKLVNRGFLNGMICPIYGIGMVIIIYLLEPFKNNIVMLFLGSMVLCSVLELITGFVLEKLFKTRWWDYSKEKFNIGGYICLKFSFFWGIAGVFAIKVIHQGVVILTKIIPDTAITITIVIVTVLLIIDIVATIIDIVGINKDLTSIDEIGEMIKVISDSVTENLYDNSKEFAKRLEERKPEFDEARKNIESKIADLDIDSKKEYLEQLKANFENKKENVVTGMRWGQRRIIKAFPNIKHKKHIRSFEEIKEKIYFDKINKLVKK